MHYYDDTTFSYQNYWRHRHYEHASEEMAITTLLKKRHFKIAADIGGGFGRLLPALFNYCDHITLVEPSQKLRALAKTQTNGKTSKLTILAGTADHTHLPNSSLDLVSIIRVIHHIPTPNPTIKELARILKPDGFLLLEYANSLHLKARITSLLTGKPILLGSFERRRPANIRRQTIPFVNHHPHTIKKLLHQNGFVIRNTLSVSNFRVPMLKRFIPERILLVLESWTQRLFSHGFIGPSIFILAQLDNKQTP